MLNTFVLVWAPTLLQSFGEQLPRNIPTVRKLWAALLAAFSRHSLPTVLTCFDSYLLCVQLVVIPSHWEQLEQTTCKLLSPRPRHWITAGVLRGVKHVGFTEHLSDLHSVAEAAKFRVVRYDSLARGGLQLTNRLDSLRHGRVYGTFLLRSAVWVY